MNVEGLQRKVETWIRDQRWKIPKLQLPPLPQIRWVGVKWPPWSTDSEHRKKLQQEFERRRNQLQDLCCAIKAESVVDLQEILCCMVLSECVYKKPATELIQAVNKFKADFGEQIICLERVQPSLDHVPHRVPVFEQRVDNIVGIAYAMDLLDFLQKQEQLDGSVMGDVAQPAYFVPDSMSVWNLLREFRIRKVHMAVVLNEYGGTIGIVTMEDVVEEIVGEIFDENDSKEEIQKKTGYIVMRADGVFDVDATTSIDQLCEDLGIILPEGHHYETVSGFVCEAFGCIPRNGESIKVVLEKAKREESNGFDAEDCHNNHEEGKYQVYKLEILAANARKVSSVRFERVKQGDLGAMSPEVTRVVPKKLRKRLRVNEVSLKKDDGKTLVKRTEDKPFINREATMEREVQHASASGQLS